MRLDSMLVVPALTLALGCSSSDGGQASGGAGNSGGSTSGGSTSGGSTSGGVGGGSGGTSSGGSSTGGVSGGSGTGGAPGCTGECTPGQKESQSCPWGTSERSCQADCTWGAFSACEAPVGWRDMAPSSSAGVPGRKNAFAVWTGSAMLVWGGNTSDLSPASYDPALNQWKKLAAAPASGMPVWTGKELVLVSPNPAQAVLRFDLAKNSWDSLPGALPIPKRDGFAFAAYLPTTHEVMVWGGRKTSCPCQLNDGAAYDLAGQKWRVVSSGPLEPRDDTRPAGVVWNGSSLVIVGGGNIAGGRYNTGAAYDPVTDGWTPIPATPASGYANQLAFPLGPGGTLAGFFSGERFGGTNYNYPANDGAVWDAALNKWTPLPGVPGGGAYNGHIHGMVFAAGSAFGLYGGTHYDNGFGLEGTGAVFDVATSTFTPLPPGGPSPRKWGVSVWTGSEAIVWGGEGQALFDDGKIWRPCGSKASDNAACAPACGVGTFSCTLGALACESTPGPEQCDGHDDDCNGQVDDGISSAGACSVAGAQGLCKTGTLECVAGATTCVGPSAVNETCNGLDDDCDGQVDEDSNGLPCTTGQNGVCSLGVEQCTNGVSSCAQQIQPNTEICNGIDDDCDGAVDEGC